MQVRVLLSSPGDVSEARSKCDGVVRNVAGTFRSYGVDLSSWRYDRDAQPGLGDVQLLVTEQIPADYEIYVGILCTRLGTPTPRALSGTVEEFEDARKRWLARGSPRILFYFCKPKRRRVAAADPDGIALVRDFRKRYPGLFAEYEDLGDLTQQFQMHLIREVLALRFPDPSKGASTGPSDDRDWIPAFVRAIDREPDRPPSAYLDGSSRKPERVLAKLEASFDLARHLTSEEREILVAASYTMALWSRTGRPGRDGAGPPRIDELLGSAVLLTAAVEETVKLAFETPADLAGRHPGRGSPRIVLLAALLQLGEALDLDQNAITPSRAGFPPGPLDDLAAWVAWFTPEVRAARGVVTFVQQVPSARWAEPVGRYTVLAFERLWHTLRNTLTRHEFGLATAPLVTTIDGESWAPPEPLLTRLTAEAESIRGWLIGAFCHLGDEAVITADDLVPLPDSAISGRTTFLVDPNHEHRLILWPVDGEDEQSERIYEAPPGSGGRIVVDPEGLPAGVRYVWELHQDDGTGDWPLSATGYLRTLSDGERALLRLCGAGASGRETLIELRLWNDLLLDLWPRLGDEATPLSERMLALRIVRAAYDWVREFTPGLAAVDLYREAGGRILQVP